MQLKRIISFCLLFLFVSYITPKELYHLFVSHHDTEHSHSKGLTEISEAHHHCDLLKADQQFASADIKIPFYDFSNPVFFPSLVKVLYQNVSLFSQAYSSKQLRAPPATV